MSYGAKLTGASLICRVHLPINLGPKLFTLFWNIPQKSVLGKVFQNPSFSEL